MATELMNTQQLWLPIPDSHKIKTTDILALMDEGSCNTAPS